jgi:hypothetical protein
LLLELKLKIVCIANVVTDGEISGRKHTKNAQPYLAQRYSVRSQVASASNSAAPLCAGDSRLIAQFSKLRAA